MTLPDPGEGWWRLDARMLAIGPVRVMRQFAVPAVIALVGIGTTDRGFSPWLVPVFLVGAVLAGAVPWLTTFVRITPTQLQVRRGLLHRTVLTAPLDRVRSVDLESSLLHRMLGLAKVTIGTGVDDTRIELDSLPRHGAERLRVDLLRRGEVAPAPPAETPPPSAEGWPPEVGSAAPPVPAPAPPPVPPTAPVELARVDWSWLRFAPFSLSRLVIVAGVLGGLAQFSEDVPVVEGVERAWEWALGQALALVLVGLAALCLVGWLVVSVAGYVLRWWGLRLVRDQGNLRLTAGLFTTRSTTVEEVRVRGVRLVEPALLRVVGGAELATFATGVGSGGTTTVLPPSPLAVDRRVAADILGDVRPLEIALTSHGGFARRRCHLRAQVATAVGVLAATVAALAGATPAWLVAAVAVVLGAGGAAAGEASYRQLGHALTAGHLVSGTGMLQRNRVVLEREGIIGWVVRQSVFQRRVGLATLVATTAAGPERVLVEDLPLDRAVALADAATPGLLTEFLTG